MDAIGSAGVGGAGGGVVGMGPAAAGAAAAGGGGGGGGGGAAAAGAAALGAAAGAAPAAPTSTTTRGIPGLTVDPSSTKSSVILPATGDGTGMENVIVISQCLNALSSISNKWPMCGPTWNGCLVRFDFADYFVDSHCVSHSLLEANVSL